MLDPDDLIDYELCFPGADTGSTEVECPHCDDLLTVRVNDPVGSKNSAELKVPHFTRFTACQIGEESTG